MANFHLSMQPISRASGRSSTAAAAYRSGSLVTDLRTGEVFDYRRKQNVVSSELFMPTGCPEKTTDGFWNSVEAKHKRGDAVVAREIEASLPYELPASERERLAHDFAKELADYYGVGVEADIHKPGKQGDNRNHHCHFLMSACKVTPDGLGPKVAELDPIHCQRHKIPPPADHWRKRWAELSNERLAENGIAARVDHRSLKEQGIERPAEPHLGPAAAGFERRTGEDSDVRIRAREQAAEAAREAARLAEVAKLEVELQSTRRQIRATHTELKAAKTDFDTAERLDLLERMRAQKAPQEEQAEIEPKTNPALDRHAENEKAQEKIDQQIMAASPDTPPLEKTRTVTAEELEKEPISEADQAVAQKTMDVHLDDYEQQQEQEQGLAPGM